MKYNYKVFDQESLTVKHETKDVFEALDMVLLFGAGLGILEYRDDKVHDLIYPKKRDEK
mgnify:CR=1 FL=1